jgi:DNA-binding NtrC family response regulator
MKKPRLKQEPAHEVPQVLIVEDDRTTAALVGAILQGHGLETRTCHSLGEAREQLDAHSEIAAAVVDLGLPDGDGIDLIRSCRQSHPGTVFFVLSARETIESAVLAMKAGALDYFTKPFDPEALAGSLRAVVAGTRSLPEPPPTASALEAQLIRWKSPSMRQAVELAAAAARTTSPVMITGAPSTGKTHLSRLIHRERTHAENALVVLDAAVLPPDEIATELFGRRPGMDSGQAGGARGKLHKGNGTTIAIQNIERLNHSLQAALLDWLGDASSHDARNASRLISMTSADLGEAVRDGSFRDDLRYALSVYHISMPSIAERPEDLPELCEDIITRVCVSRGIRRPSLTRKALEALLDHPWPGNFSELQSALEHAVTRTADRIIGRDDLPRLGHWTVPGGPRSLPIGITSLDEVNRASLIAALEACGGNRRRAAQRLKVSLRTVYNMLQRYQIAESMPSSRSKRRKPKKAAESAESAV